MVRFYGVAVCIALCFACVSSAATLDFEDLSYAQDISGGSYHDIYWEYGNEGTYSEIGSWIVPLPSDPANDYYNYPHSGSRNLINRWGCTEIGFRFPIEVFENGVVVNGAYFAVQGDVDLWAESIVVKGYKEDTEVWVTESLTLSDSPQWLAMSGELSVDRVVIYVTPAEGNDYGWFGMDDLAFDETIPEPTTFLFLGLGVAAICRRK